MTSATSFLPNTEARSIGGTMPALGLADRSVTITRPPRVDFGVGVVAHVGEWARAHGVARTLVVADPFNAARVGVLGLSGEVLVFSKVVPEPDIPNLELLMEMARDYLPDLIVGFGGGSAMDEAKLCAVLVGNSQGVRDIGGAGKADRRSVLLVQVPTTSGTGSEGGIRALVTDPLTRSKLSVESVHMLADLAVVDPALTFTVPGAVTAATGIDALAHCVEAFTSKRSHPMVDIYAREGIALIGRFLQRAVVDGSDAEARSGLALASLYGGFCLGPVNTTAGHAVSYPLGTRHKIAHGLANAVIFPHMLAFNAPARPRETRLVVERLNLDAEDLFASAHAWCKNLGVEMRLSQLGVPEDDLPLMADEAFAIRRLLDFNPRDISRDEILGIYRTAY